MPIVNGAYVSPNWVNGSTPAITAAELQAITSTLQKVPVENGGTGANTVAGARNALGLGNTSGAVPIANGGTSATTVAEARKNLGLGNTSGAVPVANGGTGNTSAEAALNDFINALPTGTSTPRDSDYYVSQDVASSTESPRYARRTLSALWSYIKGKIGLDSNGILPVSKGGTGANTVAGARNALGLGNTSGALPIANGGTGATTAANACSNLGCMPKSGGTFTGPVSFDGSASFINLIVLNANSYGTSLPTSYLSAGRLFFKKV